MLSQCMFCWVDCSESRCAQRRAPRFGAVLKESCVLHMDGKVQKEVFAKQFPVMVGKTWRKPTLQEKWWQLNTFT